MKTPLRTVIWTAVSSLPQAAEDKVSLAFQDTALRQMAEREHWNIIDVIIIPGQSRYHYTYLEFAEEALRGGNGDPMRMYQHWAARDFDVLACWEGSRFAREQSMFGEVVSRTIDMGARIWMENGGWVDKNNYRSIIAVGGYAAASEIDKLRARRDAGMRNRARRGLWTGAAPILSHLPVYDDKMKPVGLRVDESKRGLFNDLADLIIAGCSWESIERELHLRGHVAANGKPYRPRFFYELVHTPMWWGNTIYFYRHISGRRQQHYRGHLWPVEPGFDTPPPEVEIYYGMNEPVWTGDTAARVKAELHRRHFVIKGRMSPGETRPFSGLLICADCEYALRYTSNRRGYEGYTCKSRWAHGFPERMAACKQKGGIAMPVIQDYFDTLLRRMVADEDWQRLLDSSQASGDDDRLKALERDIQQAEQRISRLYDELTDAPVNARGVLQDKIKGLDEQITVFKNRLVIEQGSAARQRAEREWQGLSMRELRDMGVDGLWRKPANEINQMLLILFANVRFAVSHGEIVAVVPTLPREKRGG